MARTIPPELGAALALFLLLGTDARAEPPRLGLPIACTPGRDCFVQQYVDHDAGEGWRDYACGGASYDGHTGTDIRVRTLADADRGIAVLAAAPGTVIGLRNDMDDRLVRSDADRAAVADRECGNGVIIDHGAGWQTQYCHMRKGSVSVGKGDRVARGTRLGDVGYSGLAAFPHVHLTVRQGEDTIDPFTGGPAGQSACGETAGSLWAPDVLEALAYRAGQVLDAGFTLEEPTMTAIEEGVHSGQAPAGDWTLLVAWGWAINLRKHDEVVITLAGPDGAMAQNRSRLDRDKAQYMLYTGKRRPAEGWKAGRYVASFTVLRDGKPVLRAARPATIAR